MDGSFADVFPLADRLDECRQRLLDDPDGETLVAEVQGEIVGMAVWRCEAGSDGELEDLHVVPVAWGTGVATRLIAVAVESLQRAGAGSPFLWVGEANSRARRFYEREGWAYDGLSRPSRLGPVEMRYRLLRDRSVDPA